MQPPPARRQPAAVGLRKAWLNSGLPVQILRLPGIYGPGRSVLDGLTAGRSRRINKPDQVFCRIHVEDIAGACLHLIHKAASGQAPTIVNVVDDEPAPSGDLLEFGANLLNCELPAEDLRRCQPKHERHGPVFLERKPSGQQPIAV